MPRTTSISKLHEGVCTFQKHFLWVGSKIFISTRICRNQSTGISLLWIILVATTVVICCTPVGRCSSNSVEMCAFFQGTHENSKALTNLLEHCITVSALTISIRFPMTGSMPASTKLLFEYPWEITRVCPTTNNGELNKAKSIHTWWCSMGLQCKNNAVHTLMSFKWGVKFENTTKTFCGDRKCWTNPLALLTNTNALVGTLLSRNEIFVWRGALWFCHCRAHQKPLFEFGRFPSAWLQSPVLLYW